MGTNNTDSLALLGDLYRVTNAIVREVDHRLTALDLTFVQAVTLMAIASLDRPQPRHVADLMGSQSQTITGVLDRLERDGYVRRERDMMDRRAVRLQLTPEGEHALNAVVDELDVSLGTSLEPLDEKTRARLTEELGELERSLARPAEHSRGLPGAAAATA